MNKHHWLQLFADGGGESPAQAPEEAPDTAAEASPAARHWQQVDWAVTLHLESALQLQYLPRTVEIKQQQDLLHLQMLFVVLQSRDFMELFCEVNGFLEQWSFLVQQRDSCLESVVWQQRTLPLPEFWHSVAGLDVSTSRCIVWELL